MNTISTGIISLLAGILISTSLSANSASFNCKDARTEMEKTICSDKDLSNQDSTLANAYQTALILGGVSVKDSQRKWLKSTRSECSSLQCFKDSYSQRIVELDAISIGKDIYSSVQSLVNSGKEYSHAKEFLHRIVDSGDKRALYTLAYFFGDRRNDMIPVLKEESAKGNMDALFMLALQYDIGTYANILFAAEHGSSKAVEYLVHKNYYSGRDDFTENKSPSTAYKYYLLGKKANPHLTFGSDWPELAGELAMCSEVGDLDVEKFLSSRNLTREESPWRQARLISEKQHNPKLILQLVCIGGDVPIERRYSVELAYDSFKHNRRFKFNGCHYAQSKYSMGLCAGYSDKSY